ncbi:uncharacterized protein LOC107398847 [Tribolium castaneum]|uniref:Uncharacterized protein n=1 Tax=Tribolium castaneum TaxID=7070 RepID=D6X4C8_TRICA|nr:PREDICTED: uncharacterized protein LOC107398847 [Tribolium castaneum]EEZ97536.1 hypothetical protein TcasGA2_TC011384 [Tribolium castaneum]|eukprot:XP_015839863.1 PREDICTED: uncharacterized protein LOC107398847 [Tribolium castaneum]
MLISAGLALKIHPFGPQGVDATARPQLSAASKIIQVSTCNDNTYLLILRENEKPAIFSAKDKSNIRLIHTINVSNVTTLTFKHTTKKAIALGTKTGDVLIYDTKNRTVANTYPKISDEIKFLDFTANDKHLCGLDASTLLVITDLGANPSVKKYKQAVECVLMRCHPFVANRVAVGLSTHTVVLWDVQTGSELVSLGLGESPVSGIAMSSCGNYLVMCGDCIKIYGIDFVSGNHTFQFHVDMDSRVTCMDLSPDDRYVAIGLSNGSVRLYDVKQNMLMVSEARVHNEAISTLVFEHETFESNSHFSSMVKLSELDVKNRSGEEKSVKVAEGDDLEKFKNRVLKLVKCEMDRLESQLDEHCDKFQKFLDNEFEAIDSIISKKWNIFTDGDMNQIMKAICPEEARSSVD